MIAKGTTHNNGAKLARYLITGKDDERAELWQLRGFADTDIVNAFRSVHVMAEATHCEKPFFHVQVRNLLSDRALTRDEWEQIADRIEAKLDYTGQPRAIAFHIDTITGQEHMHIAWSRIDDTTMKAKPLPFYKLRLKDVSRELEEMFDLTRVKNARAPNEPHAATRDEAEQARRLGVDGRAIRQAIRNAFHSSENGRDFQQALASVGLLLARGDRRDFVVIDRAGGLHALGARLVGVPVKEIRARLADLDLAALPSVAEARAQQALHRRRPRGQGGTGTGRGSRRDKPPPPRPPRRSKGTTQPPSKRLPAAPPHAVHRHAAPPATRAHATHVRAVRDPATRIYVRVKPRKLKLFAHQSPRWRAPATPGLRKPLRRRLPRKPPPVAIPRRPAAIHAAFSTQGELYRFHKANGTLHEYYRMFGLD